MRREEAAMAKGKEISAEDVLRELVAGKTGIIPAEGIPGVVVVYQSSPNRIHPAVTAGPVSVTLEGEVLVDVRITGFSRTTNFSGSPSPPSHEGDFTSTVVYERVRFGIGPRTWRFPSPSDFPPEKKGRKAPSRARILAPGELPRTFGGASVVQRYAET
jgi:hypothetical protein